MKLSKNANKSTSFEILKRCGFDACDYSLGREFSPKDGIFADIDNVSDQQIEEHYSNIKDIADSLDFEVGQIHSDFSGHIHSYASLDDVIKRQIACIKATHYMGSKHCVIHPVIPRGVLYENIKKESFEKAADFYKRLTDTLEKYDVYCCLENMFHIDPVHRHITHTIFSRAEEMVEMSDLLGDRFKICLDVGHGLLTQDDPIEMVRTCGDKLVCLHTHDNDGFVDLHAIPFLCHEAPYAMQWKPLKLDWTAFMKSLDEINYRGNLNFEVVLPDPAALEELNLRYLADVGKYLVSLREIQY